MMKRIAYSTTLKIPPGSASGPVEFLCELDKRIHGKRFFLQVGTSYQLWLSDARAKEILTEMTKITEPFQFEVKSDKWVCKSCMREFDFTDGIGPNSVCPSEDCPSKWEEIGKTHPDTSASIHASLT